MKVIRPKHRKLKENIKKKSFLKKKNRKIIFKLQTSEDKTNFFKKPKEKKLST